LDLTAAVDHTKHTVEAVLSPEQYLALVKEGRRVELLEEPTRVLNAPRQGLTAQATGIPGYACYRTVDETYSAMAQLASSYPSLASWNDIGDTGDKVTAGGKPGDDMRVLVLTNKSRPGPKPRFFLMGGIHAREYTTAELTARFAEQLATKYGTDPEATQRFRGYSEALQEAGINLDDELIGRVEFESESAEAIVDGLMRRQVPFDGIVAASDLIALGGIRALSRAGRSVPRDVSVVGYDNMLLSRLSTPTLSTVQQDIPKAGRLLVAKLLEWAGDARSELLATELIIRESCGG